MEESESASEESVVDPEDEDEEEEDESEEESLESDGSSGFIPLMGVAPRGEKGVSSRRLERPEVCAREPR